MLLVDAIYINNGGGKVLLDLLIERLTGTNVRVFYLFDERIRGEYSYLDPQFVHYLQPSVWQRHKFYMRNKYKFSVVFCFANIPPSVRLDCKVYTYFHNALFLKNRKDISLLQFAKKIFIKLVSDNTDFWIVQSQFMKKKLAQKFTIDQQNVLVYPIFNDTPPVYKISTNKDESIIVNFLYVSDGHEHKNHSRLFEAFQKFNKQFRSSLTITITSQYPLLKQRVEELVKEGVTIRDIGFASKKRLEIEYKEATAIIFPSLDESFGLGLVEGALHSLPICCSDLPYVFEVVKPSLTFNPLSVDSMYTAMCKMRSHDFSQTELITKNMLTELVNTITNIKR